MNALTTLTGKPEKRSKWLFFLIVIAFIVGAIFVAKNQTFDEHNVVKDLDGLVYGIQALSNGDVDVFFDGLLDSIVVIGLFMVVFALLHFLFTHVLNNFFQSKNVATMLSLAISVYAFINHKIYNYLISLNAFTVAFLVFCAVIIMIWGFTKNVHKNYKRSLIELRKARNVARQQYASKGYVNKDLTNHMRRLQRDIEKSKQQYYKDLNNKNYRPRNRI